MLLMIPKDERTIMMNMWGVSNKNASTLGRSRPGGALDPRDRDPIKEAYQPNHTSAILMRKA